MTCVTGNFLNRSWVGLSLLPRKKKLTILIPGVDTKMFSDCLYSFLSKNVYKNASGVEKIYILIVEKVFGQI